MKNRVLKIAAAVLCSLLTIQPALMTSASSVARNSRFECEDAEIFDKNGRKISTPRLTDGDASGRAVAGSTGGKYFRFYNASEGNVIHIAYATHFTDTIDLFIRYPGEDDFRYVGAIPFSTSNSWEMKSSYIATSPIVYIPDGADIQIKPNIDVNLDCLWITSEASTDVPPGNTLPASVLSDKASDDIMAPYAKSLLMKTGDAVKFKAPGTGNYNVISLSYCSENASVKIFKDGETAGLLELSDSGMRTFSKEGVRTKDFSGGDELTLQCISGAVELGAVSADFVPEPETVRINGIRAENERVTVSLDGTWAFDVSESQQTDNAPDAVPDHDFVNSIPVPGLYHSAAIPCGSYSGKTVWYKKTVVLEKVPEGKALLYIGSAEYGRYIYVNGSFAGKYEYNYSHSYTDITEFLKQGENEIAVMLGSWSYQYNGKNDKAHVLFDGESTEDEPGFTGSVKLIFTGETYIEAIQTSPDVENGTLDVRIRLNEECDTEITVAVYEAGVIKNGKASSEEVKAAEIKKKITGKEQLVQGIKLDNFTKEKRWTPDNPFLYRIEVRTPTDTYFVRFGMRTFDFDPQTHYARLNGEKIYLFGTNVAIERYFDDPLCGTTVWQEDWVRKLYSEFKDVGWFCFRTHLGHAPELWFDIADETGMMIFDEYPIWGDNDGCTAKSIMPEIYAWIDARANHPSLIVFDAQNEGRDAAFTDDMIRLGREYDLQHRPWDNGWRPPVGENDPIECHPYIIGAQGIGGLNSMNVKQPIVTTADIGWGYKDYKNHPYLINEHGEYWINREGAAMSGTAGTWNSAYPKATNEERLEIYADLMAAQVEKFRSGRAYIGILFFCGLGSSFPDAKGVTSDVLSPDVSTAKALQIRPYTKERLKDAFAGIGVMINKFVEKAKRGEEITLPVVLTNDTGKRIADLPVTLKIKSGGKVLYKETKTVSLGTAFDESEGVGKTSFTVTVPTYKEVCADGTVLQVTASYEADGVTVCSLRKWTVKGGPYSNDPLPEFETETEPVTETEEITEAAKTETAAETP
ncbi:MAG: hypothetical protein II135_12005, partial [Clostridia bacterium]|nr:hypothetical protein [Clostridia bacterium]